MTVEHEDREIRIAAQCRKDIGASRSYVTSLDLEAEGCEEPPDVPRIFQLAARSTGNCDGVLAHVANELVIDAPCDLVVPHDLRPRLLVRNREAPHGSFAGQGPVSCVGPSDPCLG